MSIDHERYRESSKKPNGPDGREKDEAKANELKEALLNKLKREQVNKGGSGEPREETGNNMADVLKEIREIREIHKGIILKSRDNEVLLGELKSALKESKAAPAAPGSAVKSSDPNLSKRVNFLENEKYQLEERLMDLEKTLKRERKAADDLRESYERKILEASTSQVSDESLRKIMDGYKKEIQERDGVIQSLLSNRKVRPEEDRLMIVWLNAALEEERKKTAELQKRLGEIYGK